MSTASAILIYGRDLSLLETRGWVLERAGYRVCLSLTLDEVRRIASTEPVGLLLLCHSLSPEDGEEALKAMAEVRPKVKKLLVTANTEIADSACGEMTVSAFDGPRAMIAAVKKALGTEDGMGHKAK